MSAENNNNTICGTTSNDAMSQGNETSGLIYPLATRPIAQQQDSSQVNYLGMGAMLDRSYNSLLVDTQQANALAQAGAENEGEQLVSVITKYPISIAEPMKFVTVLADSMCNPGSVEYETEWTKTFQRVAGHLKPQAGSGPNYFPVCDQGQPQLYSPERSTIQQSLSQCVNEMAPTPGLFIVTDDEWISNGERKVGFSDGFFWEEIDGRKRPLANFYIQVKAIEKQWDICKDIVKESLVVDVIVNKIAYRDFIDTKDLNRLATYVLNRFNEAYLEKGTGKALDPVYRKEVAKQISACKEYVVKFVSGGWVLLNGERPVYVHDGYYPVPGYEVDTGICFQRANVSVRDVFSLLMQLTTEKKVLIPMLVYAHLGLLTQVFKDAGVPLRFILFINGRSGSFKTTVSKLLYSCMLPEDKQISGSFKDTDAGTEAVVTSRKDVCILYDDYHPTVSSVAKMMQAKLNNLTRFFGDGKGKNRSNASLELVEGENPKCLCVITGEEVDGTLSSILRCVMVEVSHDTFANNNNALMVITEFQNKPELLGTYFSNFLEFVSQNYMQIVAIIKNKMVTYRAEYKPTVKEPRLIDAAAQLTVGWEIVLLWLSRIHVISANEIEELHSMGKASILAAVNCSVKVSKKANSVYGYVSAIYEMLQYDKLRIAEDAHSYVPGIHEGFYQGDVLVLEPARIYRLVKDWLKYKGESLDVSYSKIHAKVQQEYAILDTNKGEYLKRTSIKNRPNMLHIRIHDLMKVLERTEDSYNEGGDSYETMA